jgi:SAM-dependent methyltransferase
MIYQIRLGGYRRLVWVRQKATPQFWDSHWESLSLSGLIDDARNDRVLLPVFKKFLLKTGGLILEGGCGLGQWVCALRGLGYDCVGLESASKTVYTAKGESSEMPIMVGSVLRIPFADQSLSGYISLGVAEHFLAGPTHLLAEASRVLRPGGVLLISVPYLNLIRQLKATLGKYPAVGNLDKVRENFYQFAFTVGEFEQMLAAYGFMTTALVPYDAKKGFSDEIDLAKRAIQFLRTQRRQPDQQNISGLKSSQQTAMPAAQEKGALFRLARWLGNSSLLRFLAGHMVLFVAARQSTGN